MPQILGYFYFKDFLFSYLYFIKRKEEGFMTNKGLNQAYPKAFIFFK